MFIYLKKRVLSSIFWPQAYPKCLHVRGRVRVRAEGTTLLRFLLSWLPRLRDQAPVSGGPEDWSWLRYASFFETRSVGFHEEDTI